MVKKIAAAVLFLAIGLLGGYETLADDQKPAPEGDASPKSAKASYFQGTWSGNWPGFIDSTASQDVTIIVGPEIREKVYDVKYSWGEVKWRTRTLQAGKVRTEGIEKEGEFLIQWKNKKGREFVLTLKKGNDNMVKARIERSGPTGPGERGFNETNLYRK